MVLRFHNVHKINTLLLPMKRCILSTQGCCRLLRLTHAGGYPQGEGMQTGYSYTGDER